MSFDGRYPYLAAHHDNRIAPWLIEKTYGLYKQGNSPDGTCALTSLCYSSTMPKISAGLIMFRIRNDKPEVLLVHPGGPFWAKKDLGTWSIPKGEVAPGEDALETAKREFEEELGMKPEGTFQKLGTITQKGGKQVEAWAFEGDFDPAMIRSNTFQLEWPPRSGKMQEFPEVDRAAFFDMEDARRRINPGQIAVLTELERRLHRTP